MHRVTFALEFHVSTTQQAQPPHVDREGVEHVGKQPIAELAQVRWHGRRSVPRRLRVPEARPAS